MRLSLEIGFLIELRGIYFIRCGTFKKLVILEILMAMKFCKKCGGILRSQKIDKKLSYLFCDNCHIFELIKTKDNSVMFSSEKIEREENRGEGISNDKNLLATYKNKCKECGYDKAQILDLGIFYSDEDNLILLKCGKCGFCERIGRKTS